MDLKLDRNSELAATGMIFKALASDHAATEIVDLVTNDNHKIRASFCKNDERLLGFVWDADNREECVCYADRELGNLKGTLLVVEYYMCKLRHAIEDLDLPYPF